MNLAPAFSPGFFGPAANHSRRSGRRAKKARVDDGADPSHHSQPYPVHAMFELASWGINSVIEPDFWVFLSGRPAMQPGSQVTQMTISGDYESETKVSGA